ncbi:peptidylprolyl isomerase [Shimia sp.]|uniref:peptidylprolyl isomerase n=1 Tax=Shimia sp. TaxID=1954381 RepID=UPI00356AEA2B
MPKHLNILCSVAVAALFCGPVAAQTAPSTMAGTEAGAATVVVTINGEEITLGHLIAMRESLPQQYQNLPDEVLFNGLLEQAVQQALLSQSLTGAEPARIGIALSNEHRMLRAGEAINRVLDAGVDAAELRAAYDAKYGETYVGPQEFNAAHILVETLEEAVAVRQMILDGADFAETAKEKSTGPSGPGGGALGWFGEGAMVPAFEEAVMALQPGELSPPVKTRFGFHVIKLNEIRMQPAPALEQVQEELSAELKQMTVDARIAELTESATIDRSGAAALDPAILKQTDLLDPSGEGN